MTLMVNDAIQARRHPARVIGYDELVHGLDRDVSEGFINTVDEGTLRLYKYTERCTFDRQWSPWSMIARGLILDTETRAVVATPFPKFFNYGEGSAPNQPMPPLLDEPFEVSEKIDGSLGIVFWHGGRWRVVTRGSFRSEQAVWAEAWLQVHVTTEALHPGATYLVEIVYPENRIVINYDYSSLVLLAAYAEDGYELDRCALLNVAAHAGLRTATVIARDCIDDLLAIAKTLPATNEGFVVRFASGRRIKIKGDEYCRIHRLVSNLTPLGVWELLVMGDDLDAVARDLPEEFQGDLSRIRDLLLAQFDDTMQAIERAVLATAMMDDKTLGLWLAQQTTYSAGIARWIFPSRKKRFLSAVHVPGDVMRRRCFEMFRPTANRLDGYEPSSVMNRFAVEAS